MEPVKKYMSNPISDVSDAKKSKILIKF